jgi:predicted DCC family thiol-disulfide oxidoreductase YuxK
MNPTNPVIFYDGVCALCNSSVQFVIKRDRKKRFRYAALQSDYAQKVLGKEVSFDSFVLWHEGKLYRKSTAAFKVLWLLGGFWTLGYVAIIVPSFIRNGVYDWVARNRYKWFGKYDSCPLPTAEQRALFLD